MLFPSLFRVEWEGEEAHEALMPKIMHKTAANTAVLKRDKNLFIALLYDKEPALSNHHQSSDVLFQLVSDGCGKAGGLEPRLILMGCKHIPFGGGNQHIYTKD